VTVPGLAAFGLSPSSIVAVPGGYTADCYRARAAGAEWFVKVWREPLPTGRLELLAVLADAGLPVVPPRRTLTGAVGDGQVAVFPYVAGTPAPDWSDWPDHRLRELGAVLAAVHRVDVPAVSALVPVDRLRPRDYSSEPWPPEFAGEVRDQVRRLSEIDAEPFRPVLAHADVKGDNVLFTPSGLVLLDWDGAVIGPGENDLMLAAGPDPRPLALLLDGYGGAGGDRAGLRLRRLEFCMLRRYLDDAAERARAGDLAEFRQWGVRLWRQLDAALAAAAPLLTHDQWPAGGL
jgi:aminoglycoside phosphotransferase (APT) family kinase protein